MPMRRAIAAAVSPLSPVTTWTRMPGAVAACPIAAATSGRGGSSIATRPSSAQVPLRVLALAGRLARRPPVARRRPRARAGPAAQPSSMTRGRRRHGRRRRSARSPGPRRILLARARTSSGAPLVCTRPGRRPAWSTVVISLIRGSKRNSAGASRPRRSADTSRSARGGAARAGPPRSGHPVELPFAAQLGRCCRLTRPAARVAERSRASRCASADRRPGPSPRGS